MTLQNKICLMELRRAGRIKIITNAKISEITVNSIRYTDTAGNMVTVPAAAVVSAFGYKAHNPFQETVEKLCSEVYTIGSNVKAGAKKLLEDLRYGRLFTKIISELTPEESADQ